jgi:hypothetical protein
MGQGSKGHLEAQIPSTLLLAALTSCAVVVGSTEVDHSTCPCFCWPERE